MYLILTARIAMVQDVLPGYAPAVAETEQNIRLPAFSVVGPEPIMLHPVPEERAGGKPVQFATEPE